MDALFCIRIGFMYNLLIAKSKQGLMARRFMNLCYLATIDYHHLIIVILFFYLTPRPAPTLSMIFRKFGVRFATMG
jgi:hypothetical protein